MSKSLVSPTAVAVMVALALSACPVSAQQMDQSMMNMPMKMPMPSEKKPPPKKVVPNKKAVRPAASSMPAMDHSRMNMPMPMPAAKAPAAAHKAAVRVPARKKAQARKKAPTVATPKAAGDMSMQGMDHSTMTMPMPMPANDKPMKGMDPSSMPMPAAGAMQGMDPSTMPGMGQAGMPMPAAGAMQGMDPSTMPGMGQAGMTMAPTEPREPIPVPTAADRAAAVPPAGGHNMQDMPDNSIQSFAMLDRFEAWNANPGTGVAWEGQAWIGTDTNRLWLRSEGERVDGKLESADLEVLYGRSVATWWDVVAGVRHDFKPGASQDFAAIGVIGLTPYKFEVEATGYIGQGGQTAARFEALYETLLTNRLILQPLVEVNVNGKNDERRGIGSGLSSVEAGLRLRYEFTRKFAPYVGVVHERVFGRTADFRRLGGEGIDDTRIVAGLRLWF